MLTEKGRLTVGGGGESNPETWPGLSLCVAKAPGDQWTGKAMSLLLKLAFCRAKNTTALAIVLGDEQNRNCPRSVERGQAVTLSAAAPHVSPKLFSLCCCFPCVCTASAGRTLLSNAEAVSLIP